MKKQFLSLKSQSKLKHRFNHHTGFTIVELLVVIVVIGILAAISLVAYGGVSQRAVAVSIQSDLANASTLFKVFEAETGNYPTTISTDCTASPDSNTNKCLKLSPGTIIIGYSANNSSTNKSFTLLAGNSQTTGSSSQTYKVTDATAPSQVSTTMQPNVTTGAVLELHATKANGGLSQGINSPLTTTWYDTSGNNNNGTLTNFAGTTVSGWSGSGTIGDPYRLSFDAATTCTVSYVPTNTFSTTGNMTGSVEMWVMKPVSDLANTRTFWREWGPTANEASSLTINGSTGQGRLVIRTETTQYNIGSVGPNLNDGNWHHLVGVVNGSTGYFYADGALVAQQAIPPGTLITTKGNIGYANGGYLVGSVALLRIYPFPLTFAQITANYNAGPTW